MPAVSREACYFGETINPSITTKPDCDLAGGVWKSISGDVPGYICIVNGKRRPRVTSKAKCEKLGGNWVRATLTAIAPYMPKSKKRTGSKKRPGSRAKKGSKPARGKAKKQPR